jgi:hypothetical protein
MYLPEQRPLPNPFPRREGLFNCLSSSYTPLSLREKGAGGKRQMKTAEVPQSDTEIKVMFFESLND